VWASRRQGEWATGRCGDLRPEGLKDFSPAVAGLSLRGQGIDRKERAALKARQISALPNPVLSDPSVLSRLQRETLLFP
jgi:hypothetical protein